MLRAAFLHALAGTATVATGGLDVWEPPPAQIRVLVGALGSGAWNVLADGTFTYGGKRWRGAPSTVRLADGRMALVTTIDVDQYLQGVVPLESPPSWPAAALEAQAIVARTFALARRTLSRPYDVTAGDADQRWGGVDAETASTNAAIAATRGQVLRFSGAPAAVFYSACCGGHTADIASVWGGAPLPYLRGVPDPYCAGTPDYRWSRDVPVPTVLAAFGARTGGTLVGAEAIDPDDSGRPRALELVGDATATVTIPDLRRVFGTGVILSTWVRGARVDTQAAPRLVIEGSGRGHGVGLCQWGARNFAAAGGSTAQILAHYFPGTAVSDG